MFVATSRLNFWSGTRRNLATFDLAFFNFAEIKSSYGFCFAIEVVKNSEGACVFCSVTAIKGIEAPAEFLTTSIPKQKS